MSLREVRLYGDMGRRFGREHHFDIATPAEALRALRANYGSPFDRYLSDHRDDPFRVLVGDEPSDIPRMLEPFGHETLRIVPVIHGGSKDPIVQVLIGGALILLSGPIGGFLGGAFGTLGWGLALGGVAQMLIQPPGLGTTKAAENLPSYSFSGPINSVGQQNCVPVGYGRLICGGQMISAGVFTESLGDGGATDEATLRALLEAKGKDPNQWHWSP